MPQGNKWLILYFIFLCIWYHIYIGFEWYYNSEVQIFIEKIKFELNNYYNIIIAKLNNYRNNKNNNKKETTTHKNNNKKK